MSAAPGRPEQAIAVSGRGAHRPPPAWRPYAGILLLGALAFMLPHMSPSGQVLSLATTTAVFAIAGSGFGFLWGQSGQLTLAHAAVFGLGAYSAAIAAQFFGLGFAAALPIAVLVGLIAGGLVVLPSLRTQGHYFVILTFAVGEVIALLEKRWDSVTGGANGMVVMPGSQQFLGLRLADRADFYALVVVFATGVLLCLCYLMRSRWGTTLRGMRENPELAASLGVNIALHRSVAFAIAGAIAGLAGQLYLYQVKFIAPTLFTSQASIIFLLIVLLGGKAYLLGPTVGAIAYFFLSHLLGLPPVVNQIAFGALLVLMILLAPGGLLSIPRRLIGPLVLLGKTPKGRSGAQADALPAPPPAPGWEIRL
jgi:branched-chain amino acid transport system permease protein